MGNPDYPSGKPKSFKKMLDGNPFPYGRTYEAEGGVFDDEAADSFRKEEKYSPQISGNEGDDGTGGSGK